MDIFVFHFVDDTFLKILIFSNFFLTKLKVLFVFVFSKKIFFFFHIFPFELQIEPCSTITYSLYITIFFSLFIILLKNLESFFTWKSFFSNYSIILYQGISIIIKLGSTCDFNNSNNRNSEQSYLYSKLWIQIKLKLKTQLKFFVPIESQVKLINNNKRYLDYHESVYSNWKTFQFLKPEASILTRKKGFTKFKKPPVLIFRLFSLFQIYRFVMPNNEYLKT